MPSELGDFGMKSQNFVNFTCLEDMVSNRARTAIASHAAKLRRQKRRRRDSPRAGEAAHSFVAWNPTIEPEVGTQKQSALSLSPLRRAYHPPIDVLGQGRKDPFGAFAVVDIPEIVHEVVDHAVHHFWAGLTPGSMPNPENPVVAVYLDAIRQAPLPFYAYMVATAENYELLSGISSKTGDFSQLCLSYRVEMIKLVNLELQSIDGPPSDHLIGAIIVLIANYVLFAGQVRIASLESAHASRFRSPLRTAQFIHIYSMRPLRSPHTEALVRLMIMKGGCSKIALPGVASTVALCDLVHASQTNSQLYILSIDPPSLTSLVDLRLVVSSSPLMIWERLPILPGQLSQLAQAVEALSLVNNALEWYLRGSIPSIEYPDLVNARNAAQYLLLSIMPAYRIEQNLCLETVSEDLFEVARLGLRIFSNIVIFPMNPAGGTARILSFALRDALTNALTWYTEASWREVTELCKELLLWSFVLGGVQADDDHEDRRQNRRWFLTQFTELSSLVNVSTWDQVKECLSAVLWSEPVLSLAAWEFWNDSQEGIVINERG